ncbi:MAG: 50S ribosomal protein L30 [Clostridia bacterium]|nr:50S ribosomal protein L30 [Clostridia bacterium]MBQ3638908.1 50S ribosomal protein L30 [Clostridia bacterium]
MKKVTLKKSLIGALPKQKATAQTLGLKKIGDSTVQKDDAVLAGKIRVLAHLVAVETVEEKA